MRNLSFFAVAGLLASLPAFAADPKDGDKVPDDLAAALKQLGGLDSYAFQMGNKQNGVEGKYQKGQPVYFNVEQIEFFKSGDKLVYRQGEKWERSKTGIESDPLRILGAAAKVRQSVLPHEELSGLEKQLERVKSEPSQGYASAYAAHLTLDGCKKLLLPADQALARAGRISFQLDKEGTIVQYDIAIDIEGKRGNADVKGTVQRTTKLTELGKVKVEVPEPAKKALSDSSGKSSGSASDSSGAPASSSDKSSEISKEQTTQDYDSRTQGALEVTAVSKKPSDWFIVEQDGKTVLKGTPPLLNTSVELAPGEYVIKVNRTQRKVTIAAGKKTVLGTGELIVEAAEGAPGWYTPYLGKEAMVAASPPRLNVPIALFAGKYQVTWTEGGASKKVDLGEAELKPGQRTTLKK